MCTQWKDRLGQDSDRNMVDRRNIFSHYQSRDGLHYVSSSICTSETWRLTILQDRPPKPYYRGYVSCLVAPYRHMRCRFLFRRCSLVSYHVV